jgi:hypothetical protein
MVSENTQKQLQLVLGILTALVAIVGGATNLLDQITAFQKFGPWVPWLIYVALFALGIWLLYQRGTHRSRLLKPDALRLDRDNAYHLVGRVEDIDNLLQQCLAKPIVFLEGESGSGKSALVRAGLLPKLKDEKSLLPLMLSDRWVDEWDRSPLQALKSVLIATCAAGSDTSAKPSSGQLQSLRRLSTLADVEQELTRLNDEAMRPLIIFDQFDDYQARNLKRFLPNKIWLAPASLRQNNAFWDMVARLLEQEKLRCLFVTRSDTAGGLTSVEFLGSVQPMRLDRVASPYIAQLLRRLTEDTIAGPVISDPEAGWSKLRDRIVHDISEQEVVLPQRLKIILGGIQNLEWLNIAQYERRGGAIGIEAFYIEQQISGTARKVGLDASQVREILVALIDPLNPTKTWSRSKEDLLAAATKLDGQLPVGDKLDNALEELERSEMVRSPSAPEDDRTAYRLDHDYLTRGVSAVERMANRWHYLLEDKAKDFQNAGTLWKKWKALLPAETQCRLMWERLRGRFHYGNRRSYAVLSLARLLFRTAVVGTPLLITLALLVAVVYAELSDTTEADRRALLDSSLKEVRSLMDADKTRSWTRAFEFNLLVQGPREELRTLATRAIEEMQNITNGDQVNALVDAIELITRQLKPDDRQALAGSILLRIQSTTGAANLSALTQAFAAVSGQLPPKNARAIADAILQAIKNADNYGQRHALGLALAAVATRLNLEEAVPLDGSIVEAIKGKRTLPLAPAHR